MNYKVLLLSVFLCVSPILASEEKEELNIQQLFSLLPGEWRGQVTVQDTYRGNVTYNVEANFLKSSPNTAWAHEIISFNHNFVSRIESQIPNEMTAIIFRGTHSEQVVLESRHGDASTTCSE